MPRLFIGIPASDQAKSALTACIQNAKPLLHSSLTWSKPVSWHLTLKFLGDIAPDKTEDIASILASINFAPFSIHLSGGGYFPDIRRPRVAWVGVSTGKEQLITLAKDIENELVRLGYEPETRPFRPHWTICRIKRPSRQDNWNEFEQTITKMPWPEMIIDAFTLFESRLTPHGAIHTALAQYDADDA
ncbi:RNA 2',3'-cyclic phosphodiesterase [Desulfovibrio inopinatus]|uniref:RNA 2',3'-cyclic phosphodiesterase n=1 Tax=Desulfovibrio inopinatus TaxID=102109 RepID=UPI0004216E51|nr:RNA 2',3'-cyclic phosphodiesterase [Desulfovibrio inopinatus]